MRRSFDAVARRAAEDAGRLMEARRRRDGLEILAEVADRGLTVQLGPDGAPRVGPRSLLDAATLARLRVHRAEILAALTDTRPAQPELDLSPVGADAPPGTSTSGATT